MSIMSQLWMTKYRPKTLDEIVLPEATKSQIKQWIESGSIPNLMLIGQPGTGKTSLANVIKHSMNVEMLTINGSEERGIDVIRSKIMNFALAGSNNLKIVFIDEADGLTPDAQQSLRHIIEEYADTTRFIFTANYDKFIQPLKDRFTIIYFDKLTKEDVKRIVTNILNAENIKYTEEDVDKVINMLYPSLRSIVQTLQSNISEDANGNKVLQLINIVKSNDLELQQDILHTFFAEGNINRIREIISSNNIADFTELYKLFFDNVKDPYDKLIVTEFLYRDKQVSDREINFVGMLYALQLKAIPFTILNQPNPVHSKQNTVIQQNHEHKLQQEKAIIEKKQSTSGFRKLNNKQQEQQMVEIEPNQQDDSLLDLDDLLS